MDYLPSAIKPRYSNRINLHNSALCLPNKRIKYQNPINLVYNLFFFQLPCCCRVNSMHDIVLLKPIMARCSNCLFIAYLFILCISFTHQQEEKASDRNGRFRKYPVDQNHSKFFLDNVILFIIIFIGHFVSSIPLNFSFHV